MDRLDEELEMNLDDNRLSGVAGEKNNIERQKYFKELLDLQGELMKL